MSKPRNSFTLAKDTTDILPVIVPATVTPEMQARTTALEARNWRAWFSELRARLAAAGHPMEGEMA